MSNTDAGGLLAGFIGALIGVYYPTVVVVAVAVLFTIFIGTRISSYYQRKRPWIILRYNELESKFYSMYYRTRVRVLVRLGLVRKRSA